MFGLALVALAFTPAQAFVAASARATFSDASRRRTMSSPAMQFFGKKKEPAAPPPPEKPASPFAKFTSIGKKGAPKPRKNLNAFYDDEKDTVGDQPWNPNVVEQSEDNDLATQGAGLYVAFLPFLLFVIAFSTGGFSFGYDKGNF